MRAIWTYAIDDAIKDGDNFFFLHCFGDNSAHCRNRRCLPSHRLRHPLSDYYLVSKAVKQEVDYIVEKLHPGPLRFVVAWCPCMEPQKREVVAWRTDWAVVRFSLLTRELLW